MKSELTINELYKNVIYSTFETFIFTTETVDRETMLSIIEEQIENESEILYTMDGNEINEA